MARRLEDAALCPETGRLALSCAICIFPFEIWYDILNCIACTDEALASFRAFSAASRHARWLALPRAYKTLSLHSSDTFFIRRYLDLAPDMPLPDAFCYTSSMQIFTALSDLPPVLSLATETLLNLTTLNIAVRPVLIPLVSFERAAFAEWLHALNYLTRLDALRELYIYIFFDHEFIIDQELDLSAFTDLSSLAALDLLAMRIGGGVSLFHQQELALPPQLPRARLTVQTLARVAHVGWPAIGALQWLSLEDERESLHLRRRETLDAAHELSAGLIRCHPYIYPSLTTLRLLGCFIDYPGLSAIAQLPVLTRLDFHPRSVELSAREQEMISANATVSLRGAPPPLPINKTHLRIAADTVVAVGTALGTIVPAPTRVLAGNMEVLKYLLIRIRNLRVLRWAFQPHPDGQASTSPQDLEDDFVASFALLRPFLVHGTSFLHLGLGPEYDSVLTIHLATCSACAHVAQGTISQDCRLVEDRAAKLDAREGARSCPPMLRAHRPFDLTLRRPPGDAARLL